MKKGPSLSPGWKLGDFAGAAFLSLLLGGLPAFSGALHKAVRNDALELREIFTQVPPPPPPILEWTDPPPEPPPEEAPLPVEIPSPAPTPPTPMPVLSMPMAFPGFTGDLAVRYSIEAPPALPSVFSLGEIDTPPRPLSQPGPLYPHHARLSGLEGRVLLQFVIGVNGSVTDIEVLDSSPGKTFVAAATSAVSGWRFEAAQRQGQPVPVRVSVPIQFQIDR